MHKVQKAVYVPTLAAEFAVKTAEPVPALASGVAVVKKLGFELLHRVSKTHRVAQSTLYTNYTNPQIAQKLLFSEKQLKFSEPLVVLHIQKNLPSLEFSQSEIAFDKLLRTRARIWRRTL